MDINLTTSQAKKPLAIRNLTKRLVGGLFLINTITLTGLGGLGLYTNMEKGKHILHEFSVSTTEEAKIELSQEFQKIEGQFWISVLICLGAIFCSYAQKSITEVYAYLAIRFYLRKILEKELIAKL